jgi:hypothetical protein
MTSCRKCGAQAVTRPANFASIAVHDSGREAGTTNSIVVKARDGGHDTLDNLITLCARHYALFERSAHPVA